MNCQTHIFHDFQTKAKLFHYILTQISNKNIAICSLFMTCICKFKLYCCLLSLINKEIIKYEIAIGFS